MPMNSYAINSLNELTEKTVNLTAVYKYLRNPLVCSNENDMKLFSSCVVT